MSRFAFPAAMILIAALHLAAVFYFAPPRVVFGNDAISNIGYDLRAGETFRVTEAMSQRGESWAYDARFRAGSPVGVFVDTNSRAWQLWTLALSRAGLGKAAAFNAFVLLAHLLAPWVLLAAARLFGLGRWACLTAMLLGACLWFFDSYLHWCWWAGTPDWAMASYLAPLVLALMYRFVTGPRLWTACLLAVAAVLAHLVHSFIAFALVVPAIALYLAKRKDLGTAGHLGLVGAIAATMAAVAYWIFLRLDFSQLGNASMTMGMGTISHLLTDFVGLTSDTRVSGGVGMRSGFRFLTWGAAAITVVLWYREGDGRARMFAAGLVSLALATYLGGYLWGLGGIQPYRFVAPLTFLAVIPAAELVDQVRRRGALEGLPTMARMVLILIALAVLPRLGQDVVYFTPALTPTPKELPKEKPHIADIIGFGSIGYPRHRDYRQATAPDHFKEVARWLKGWRPSHGRIMVEYWPLAEYLARTTDTYILGGSRLRDRQHSAADLFHRYPSADPAVEEIDRYVRRYAVGIAIVIMDPSPAERDYLPRLAGVTHLLEPIFRIAPFQILKSHLEVSYFAEGQGRINASTNHIEVSDTPPGEDLTLKFHWLKTLVCRPDCKVERAPVDGDPVGFIRVPAPHPADFAISNGY